MRLNEKTFPVLKQLEKGDLKNISVCEGYYYAYDNKQIPLPDLLETAHNIYGQVANRYLLTDPFIKAIDKASHKIIEGDRHWENQKSDCGIIFGNGGAFFLYLINPADKLCKFIIIGFDRTSLTHYGVITNDAKMFGCFWRTDKAGKLYNDYATLGSWLNSAMITIYFIHNCEIETKIVKPNEKHRLYGVKYFNESKSPFTILDCNWFTNLIRDTPFTVNGHFRWQPCGINLSKKKLIWIDTFEKKGYTRKAKIDII